MVMPGHPLASSPEPPRFWRDPEKARPRLDSGQKPVFQMDDVPSNT
jgi:hypothetical protein